MTVLLLTLLLAADPCASVQRSAPDARLASIYEKVAQEEGRRGAKDASAAAWRLAAQLEPPGAPAARALQRLCLDARAAIAFEQGQEHFNRHDCSSALPLLREAKGGSFDSSAALLEGICAYELADDAGAAAALTRAAMDPQLAPTAELFLGLLALRQGDRRSALALMRTAASASNDGLRGTAAQLQRLIGRKERLVLDGAFEGGYDSNASLSAFATVVPGGADDGFGAATVGLALRPWSSNGPFLAFGGGYRKQAIYAASDVGLAAGALGWEQELGPVRASVDYGLEFVGLGAAPWMLGHRGTVRGLVPLKGVLVFAQYALGHEAFWAASLKADSGLRHAGRVGASFRVDRQLLEVAALVSRALGETAERSSIETGGELRWGFSPLPRVNVSAALGVRWRRFDAVDSELAVRREEIQADGRVSTDWELTENLALFIALEGRRVCASVAALTYTRLSISAGARFSLGLW